MTDKTAWAGGNLNSGIGWADLIESATINQASFTNGSSVLASTVTLTNGTSLDQFMDISLRAGISSSTIAAGANFAFYLFALLDDGTTYGDASLTAGAAPSANLPSMPPCAIIPLRAAASQTTLVGFAQGIILPPGSFRMALQNNCGFTLNSSSNVCKYRSYNMNLNN